MPTVLEFKNRIASTLKRYPYLAAIRDGHILGYAYASAFKERAAYDWAVETSIYVSEGARRTGAGSLLYEALEDYLKRQNVINFNACIASPNAAINWASGGIWSGWKKCWGLIRNSRSHLYRLAGFSAWLLALDFLLRGSPLPYCFPRRPYIPASRLHRFTVSSCKSSLRILHRQFFPRVDGSLILADVSYPR